ncbi:MAG TPA: DMT family transporter [Rubrobacter sp.]|nr:DMT family transporter [Rubrobacter sp.]
MLIFGKRRFVVLSFVLLVLFWSSTFSVVKVGLVYSPPVLFAGLRSIVGGLSIVVVASLWGGRPDLSRDWAVYASLTMLNVVSFLGLQTFAIMLLPSGTAAVLIYLQPILTGLLAWFMLGETLSVAKFAGLFLGFSGIVAVSVGGFSGKISVSGVAFAVVSALMWALGTVYFKGVQDRVSMLWAVALMFVFGGIVLSALGLVIESPAEITLSGSLVASVLYSGIVGTGLAWVLWLGLVRAGEAGTVAAYVFFVPLASVAIGALFLDERPSTSLLVGAVLVVSGIYLVNRTPGKGPRDTSP